MSNEIFDHEELLEEIDEDWEFLEESVDMLEQDAPGLLEKIQAGVASADPEMIWQNAHTIKSMVGNFSAVSAMRLAAEIEHNGRESKLETMVDDAAALTHEIARLSAGLRELIASHKD